MITYTAARDSRHTHKHTHTKTLFVIIFIKKSKVQSRPSLFNKYPASYKKEKNVQETLGDDAASSVPMREKSRSRPQQRVARRRYRGRETNFLVGVQFGRWEEARVIHGNDVRAEPTLFRGLRRPLRTLAFAGSPGLRAVLRRGRGSDGTSAVHLEIHGGSRH